MLPPPVYATEEDVRILREAHIKAQRALIDHSRFLLQFLADDWSRLTTCDENKDKILQQLDLVEKRTRELAIDIRGRE